MKVRRFSIHDVYRILYRHFKLGQTWQEIQKDYPNGQNKTTLWRITLPKGHHDVRYPKERERFFKGYIPLSIQEEFKSAKAAGSTTPSKSNKSDS